MKKQFGVLAPVFSLDGKYGIGTFGEESYRFSDFLAKSGAKVWQTLPLCQTVFGDSPYQTTADCSFNPYFTDLDDLFEQGLLLKSELTSAESENKRIDYGKLYRYRIALLKKAFSRFDFSDEFVEFVNGKEFDDYALFMALKDEYGSSDNFPEEYKKRDKRALSAFKEKNYENYLFYVFTQFTLKKQYGKLKKYANERGIKIMGDLPLYVARDSAEVWKEPEVFALDKDMKPTLVAGVPPDYFSATGQLWGNPLYDWDKMKADGFGWWIRRVEGAGKLYDVIRIDPFRGFESYWAVPYGDKTARNGHWCPGPGMDLVGVLTSWFGNLDFIAEDLGYTTPAVEKLLADSKLPGMKILEFAFDA
ncbi:MAG TPA: 4-alpha-glucanotransferase, partial [Clostridiales bacterium]|nr:4-alpha-glucanotransferase [Clostridiales bacterium]